MLVFLNPRAAGGASWRRWQVLRPVLERRALRGAYDLVTDRGELEARLAAPPPSLDVLVAAGGDGTVNLAASALMRLPEPVRHLWRLGAIGLGSSNDFHKRATSAHGGPPLRLDADRARPCPVGQVDFLDEDGAERRGYFLVNASIGIVARGNHLFNAEDAVLRWLKPRWTSGAIGYAAIRAVLAARDLPASLAVDGARRRARLTSLHVLLSPHVSGGLRYDIMVPAERAFAVAWCEGLALIARARSLVALARGRFTSLPWAHAVEARTVDVDVPEATPLETDGEVCLARAIRFRHLPGALSLCA